MKEVQAIKPRRPHHKSRTGCAQCKQRKVKCDESKPVCRKCTAHGQTCSYLQTHPIALKRGPPTISSMLASQNPTPTSSSPMSPYIETPLSPSPSFALPAIFTILDLELLHFWVTQSASSFVDFSAGIILFQSTVIEIAITHQFLMHELLSLSALHLSTLQSIPSERAKYMHASNTHLATALSLFQPEIANLTAANCHACFAFSTAIFTHSWAAQDLNHPSSLFFVPKHPGAVDGENVQWVKLHRGGGSIREELWLELKSGPLEGLFAPWLGLDPGRHDPLNPTEEREISALTSVWNSPSCSLVPEDRVVLDEALHILRRVFSMMEFEPQTSGLSIVMAWFSMISEEFLKMLEEKVPEALILVVFYCAAFKRLDHLWWVEGKGKNLLKTVLMELEPGRWDRWLKWPIEQVVGSERLEGFDGERLNVDRLAVSDIMNVDE